MVLRMAFCKNTKVKKVWKFKSIAFLLIVTFSLTLLNGCKKKSDKKSFVNPISLSTKQNPIATFCGTNCARCGFNVTQCLTLLKENLSNLCGGPYKTNCYHLWLNYAKTCHSLCGEENKKNLSKIKAQVPVIS
jgi:hypothetical protein